MRNFFSQWQKAAVELTQITIIMLFAISAGFLILGMMAAWFVLWAIWTILAFPVVVVTKFILRKDPF